MNNPRLYKTLLNFTSLTCVLTGSFSGFSPSTTGIRLPIAVSSSALCQAGGAAFRTKESNRSASGCVVFSDRKLNAAGVGGSLGLAESETVRVGLLKVATRLLDASTESF